jgi:hypothetical protein
VSDQKFCVYEGLANYVWPRHTNAHRTECISFL